MTKHEAISIILNDVKSWPTSLNYAVDYCSAAMTMKPESEAFKTQTLYILNNITRWRHPQAKEVRKTLKSK